MYICVPCIYASIIYILYISYIYYVYYKSAITLNIHIILYIVLDGYCSTVQGLLDWFEVDLGFTELLFIQIDLCVL